MTPNDTDYAELWLDAQKAHKAIFEAALRKDWEVAWRETVELERLARKMRQWFVVQERAK